jgi:two-component system copper resistance phosphate regulon response regulator CusR
VKLLVIEDNQRLARTLALGLGEENYEVDLEFTGEDGLAHATEGTYDAIVLDLMLPGIDGLTVLQRLRRHGSDVPVLILTARDDIDDRVTGLDHGADDYLVKPFAFEELLARLRAVIRRGQGTASNTIRIDDLEVDSRGRRVLRGGEPVDLSAREYAVLEYLARHAGQTVTRDQLIGALYDPTDEPSSNVVEVFIRQLRRKIDREGTRKLIHTRRGLGYVLEARDD